MSVTHTEAQLHNEIPTGAKGHTERAAKRRPAEITLRATDGQLTIEVLDFLVSETELDGRRLRDQPCQERNPRSLR